MHKILRPVLFVLVIAAVAATAIYWFGSPQVQMVSPPDGSAAVAANEPVRLEFSHPMQADSVTARLQISPAVETTHTWEANTLVITPARAWQAGATVQVALASGALSQGLISLPVQRENSWSFTVRQVYLAYLYPANAPANIFVINPATSVNLQLTRHALGVQDYMVDGAGKRMVYSARNEIGGSDIYSLVLDFEALLQQVDGGLQPQLLVECGEVTCRAPVLSPAGDMLAYERTEKTGFPQVWVSSFAVDAGGQTAAGEAQPTRPVLAGDAAHQTLLPTWSADGLLTFYDTQEQAFISIDPKGSERLVFSNQTGQQGTWRPNGREFVAAEINFLDTGSVSDLPNFANSHLILYNRLTGSKLDLTPEDDMEDSFPVFSPDGAYLAYARKYLDKQRWTPGRQLWVMLPGIGQAQPITADPEYNHFDFAWNAQGDQLAYVRFNQAELTALPEIWLLDLLSAQRSELVKGGYLPQWLP